MTAITDFADQAVVLPMAAAILALLLWARRPRAALAFAAGLAVLDGAVGVAKVLGQCAPDGFLGSPSGHTASAAYVFGCGLGLVCGASRDKLLWAALALAAAIGFTRVALGLHTVFEVCVGGASAMLVSSVVARHAGAFRPVPPLPAAALAAPLLLHGTHLNAEPALQALGRHWIDLCARVF